VGEQTEGVRERRGRGGLGFLSPTYTSFPTPLPVFSPYFTVALLQVLQGMLHWGLGTVLTLWQGLGDGYYNSLCAPGKGKIRKMLILSPQGIQLRPPSNGQATKLPEMTPRE